MDDGMEGIVVGEGIAFETDGEGVVAEGVEGVGEVEGGFAIRRDGDAGGAKALAAKCLERGLLILTCGVYADTVRMLTPLTASEMVLKDGLDILESAILGN